jgi:hypothetical protein
MALPLLAWPVILEVIKQIKTRPRTGKKELYTTGIVASGMYLMQDIESCSVGGINALSCVTADHWGFFMVAVVALIARLNSKRVAQ